MIANGELECKHFVVFFSLFEVFFKNNLLMLPLARKRIQKDVLHLYCNYYC